MANTTFVDFNPPAVNAAWLNDANGVVYNGVRTSDGALGSNIDQYKSPVAGTNQRSVGAKIGERVSVLDFGAVGDGVTDCTAAFQAALNLANTTGKALVYIPAGSYVISSTLTVYANTSIVGEGYQCSTILGSMAGDCLSNKMLLNGSQNSFVSISGLAVNCTNGASTGAGILQASGTVFSVKNCSVSGFKYQVLLCQTVGATVTENYCNTNSGQYGIWISNGSDYIAGANTGFNNRNTVMNNVFSGSGSYAIANDGSDASEISNNYIGGAYTTGIFSCASSSLKLTGNTVNGTTTNDVVMSDSKISSTYVNPCNGALIADNILNQTGNSIQLNALVASKIVNNTFTSNVTNCIATGSTGVAAKSVGNTIEGNIRKYNGTINSSSRIVDSFFNNQNNMVQQFASTFCTSSAAVGTVVIAPIDMTGISPNTILNIQNNDGSNMENAIVISTTAGSFTCALTQTKNANFIINGAAGVYGGDQLNGSYVPLLMGSTVQGVNTYSLQAGTYQKRGATVTFQAAVQLATKDAAMAGNIGISLPFQSATSYFGGGVLVVICTVAGTGWSSVNGTYLTGQINASSGMVNIMTSGTGLALNYTANGNYTSTATLYVSGTYQAAY